MAKDPAALLYIDKWMMATTEMKPDARAYYMDLILSQFDKGDLPNDIEELASICRVRVSEFENFKHVFEHVLEQKFKQNKNGRLENEFAKEIIQKRKRYIDERIRAGKISYLIKYMTDTLNYNSKKIEYFKNNLDIIDFETVDLKNKQVLEQVFEQVFEHFV